MTEPNCSMPGLMACECNHVTGCEHPAPVRHTADTITDTDLDQLYARIEKAERAANIVAEPNRPTECSHRNVALHSYGDDCAHLADYDPLAGLRDRYAAAIHRYDYEHTLSGNDIPSDHHRGEADAVLAVRDIELTHHRRVWREQHAALFTAWQDAGLRAEKAASAITRVRAALDAAEWGGPDREDVITEIRAALTEPKEPRT